LRGSKGLLELVQQHCLPRFDQAMNRGVLPELEISGQLIETDAHTGSFPEPP